MDVNCAPKSGEPFSKEPLIMDTLKFWLLLQAEFNCDVHIDTYDEAGYNTARGGHASVAKYMLGHVQSVRSYYLQTVMFSEAAR